MREYTPEPGRIRFKDGDRVRPVAPFLEVFAQTSKDMLEPLTLRLLADEGLGPDAMRWTVRVGNLKVFRQTGDPNDRVYAAAENFTDHDVHELRGRGEHFLKDKCMPFGTVRYIRPTEAFPQIRLRFTPAIGHGVRFESRAFRPGDAQVMTDPVFADDSRIVYDAERGKWRGFPGRRRESGHSRTRATSITGYWPDSEPLPIELGLPRRRLRRTPCPLEIVRKDGSTLTARAWVSTGTPAFAPDSLPMRTVADELEQVILGPEIADAEVSIDEADEIVRRALETVRLMNIAVMNGNPIDGRPTSRARWCGRTPTTTAATSSPSWLRRWSTTWPSARSTSGSTPR